MSDSGGGQGNIFLTRENLVFSLPLITLCSTYAFFKFVPLVIGIPLVASVVGLWRLRTVLVQRHAEQRQRQLDLDLQREMEAEESAKAAAEAKRERRANAKLTERLLAEKKAAKEAAQKVAAAAAFEDNPDDDDDDDDGNLQTFAKSNKKKQK